MSIRRSASQLYFESMFVGNGGIPFRGIRKTTYENTCINHQQANDLSELLEEEILYYYYKALLSYAESIPAIENRLFSWATVRLYYSVFYAIKSFLASKNVAIVRAERRLFYIEAKENSYFKRCDDNTDHKGTILTFCKLFGGNDILLSNNIEDITVYQWMMNKREEINYKDIEFHDPNPPEFWNEINKYIVENGVSRLIDVLVADNWIYCFQEDFAVLGIPTKRLLLTSSEIKRKNLKYSIPRKKREFIESMPVNIQKKGFVT